MCVWVRRERRKKGREGMGIGGVEFYIMLMKGEDGFGSYYIKEDWG